MCGIHHIQTGLPLRIHKWKVIRQKQYGVYLEHALVSATSVDMLHIYPVGTYECANCVFNKNKVMHENMVAYYHKGLQQCICSQCYLNCDSSMVQRMCKTVEDKGETIPKLDIIEFIDVARQDNKKMAQTMNTAEKFAQVHGYHYKNNKTTAYFRKYFLAKRVLRAFQLRVHQRRTLRLFQVLYQHANLGLDCAMTMAKTVKV